MTLYLSVLLSMNPLSLILILYAHPANKNTLNFLKTTASLLNPQNLTHKAQLCVCLFFLFLSEEAEPSVLGPFSLFLCLIPDVLNLDLHLSY